MLVFIVLGSFFHSSNIFFLIFFIPSWQKHCFPWISNELFTMWTTTKCLEEKCITKFNIVLWLEEKCDWKMIERWAIDKILYIYIHFIQRLTRADKLFMFFLFFFVFIHSVDTINFFYFDFQWKTEWKCLLGNETKETLKK